MEVTNHLVITAYILLISMFILFIGNNLVVNCIVLQVVSIPIIYTFPISLSLRFELVTQEVLRE